MPVVEATRAYPGRMTVAARLRGPRRTAVLALVTGLTARPVPAQPADFPDLLERARQQWVAYERALGSVLADEHYRQEAWWRAGRLPVVRTLASELLLFRAPDIDDWVAFREVRTVDGAVPDEPSPSVTATLADGSRSLSERVGHLVRASARYNLGDIERTINTPTFAPIVLRPVHRSRVRFTRQHEAMIGGRRTVVVRFEETARPTVVRGRGTRDVPMRGELWLDLETAEVRQSRLQMTERRTGVAATLEVVYAHAPSLDLWVPATMKEVYVRRGHRVTADAVYTNYRRFTTAVRVVGAADRRRSGPAFPGGAAEATAERLELVPQFRRLFQVQQRAQLAFDVRPVERRVSLSHDGHLDVPPVL